LRARPVDDARAGEPDDARDGDAGEKLGDGQGADDARPQHDVEEPLVVLVEALLLVPLLTKRLHDAIALRVLVQERVQAPDRLLLSPARLSELPREVADGERRHREETDGEEGQHPVHVDGDGNQAEEPCDVLEERRECIGHRRPDERHVRHDARDDLSGSPTVEEGEIETLEVGRQLVAQIGHHSLADPVGQVPRAEIEATTQDRRQQHEGHGEGQRARVVLREDLVECELGEERDRALRGTEGKHAGHCDRAMWPDVWPEVREEPAVVLHGTPRKISRAIAAARPAAPPRPRRRRTSRRATMISAWRAGSARMARAAATMPAPLARPWSRSGTPSRPATMFGMAKLRTTRTTTL